MKRILKERDRLLRRLARVTGMTGALGALLCLMVPTGGAPGAMAWGMLGCLATAAAVGLATGRDAVGSSVAVVAASGAAVLAIALASNRLYPSTATAVVLLSGLAAASVAFLLVVHRRRRIPLALLAAIAIGLGTAASFRPGGLPGLAMLSMSLVWLGMVAIALWIDRAIGVAISRIDEVGGAHRAERLASELEARQRQDARLLHDTVLATLSLLAHAGVGVAPETLREQAREDARLLRQLRLDATAAPQAAATFFTPEPPDDDEGLGATLESVKQRFGRMGLEVHWHGTGQVLLPRETLDALLGAMAECLENVRRHSGVVEADVTVTDDQATVRAMITDAGVGFDVSTVDPERLGFAESVVGRLHAVGGRVRLFSSPGSGTTVMLEVPKP
ncbi:ATP-binding protein [Agromyces sp. SYSU T00194]|uniref:ATP-binding protein n=1 Tax=Agromyces chitinivorans TaxID=3158560 RepID=UPI0033982AC3